MRRERRRAVLDAPRAQGPSSVACSIRGPVRMSDIHPTGSTRRAAAARRRSACMSTSAATKARSTCCSTSPAGRRSTSPQISVLALAEQYLELHRDGAREAHRDRRRLPRDGGLAGLPQEPADGAAGAASDDEPTGEMMAALLQFRLKRLEAMRQAAQQLMNRPRLGLAGLRPRRARADHRQPPQPVGSQPLRPAQGLCRRSASAASRTDYHAARAHRLVAAGGARDPAAADRRKHGLGAARRLSRRVSRLARAARHRHGLDLRLEPRTGAPGASRTAPDPGLRAAARCAAARPTAQDRE